MVHADRIPELAGGSVQDVKIWCREVAGLIGGGWHPDDGFAGFEDIPEDASVRMDRSMNAVRKASRKWVDPDFIYSLAGEGGRFLAEEEWPGFEVDVTVPGADRTGYQIWRGRADPTFVVEDMDRFFAVSFPGDGPLSSRRAVVAELEGARFDLTETGREGYIDTSDAVLAEGDPVEVSGFREVERAVETLLSRVTVRCP